MATQDLSFQFSPDSLDESRTLIEPRSVFLDNLFSIAMRTNPKRIAPSTRATDVDIVG